MNTRHLLNVLLLLFIGSSSFCQDILQGHDSSYALSTDKVERVDSKRKNPKPLMVASASIAGLGGSFAFLNQSWYQEYARTPFHTFNDMREWLQMDKTGHAWTAYSSSRLLYGMWRWAGVENQTAIWISSFTSLAYMTSIEYLDGRSAGWGWSWGDIAGNTIGASLFAVQQLEWKEQRLQLKFSAHLNRNESFLQPRADALFGKTVPQRLLKDYNGQTYWLSMNIKSFFPKSNIPAWLNIAAGYGAEGMWGGFENTAYDQQGHQTFDRPDIIRRRQWYLSPDIDLTKIKTRRKVLQATFAVLNQVKVPLPSLEYSQGKWQVHPFYF